MVLGLFATHAEAERAIGALTASGFGPDRIGFLGPGEVRERDRGRSHVLGTGIGAVTGGVVGGLLGALVAAVTPGIGHVIGDAR